MEFVEVQRVGEWWLWAIMLAVAVPFAGGAWLVFRSARRTVGTARKLLIVAGLTTTFLALVPVLILTVLSMRTETEAEGLHVRITPLLLDDVIPYADIEHLEVRRYDPIREYGGWGIRYGRDGRAYNMTGDRGVQLVLSGQRRLLIGSQRPEELAAALRRHTPTRP